MKHARPLALLSAMLLAASASAQVPGQVLSEFLMTEGSGFTGPLDPGDRFGQAVCVLGDLDGDGIDDLAVGAPGDDAGGFDRGAVWLLFLDANGAVRDEHKIAHGIGGFSDLLENGACFGASLAGVGDLDGNGVPDLAVGGPGLMGGQFINVQPRYWILLLQSNGTVTSTAVIPRTQLGSSSLRGGFAQGLDAADLDGDGRREVIVGDMNGSLGTVYTVRHDPFGGFVSSTITSISAPFTGFGYSVAAIGDRNEDGISDILVGEPFAGPVLGSNSLSGRIWVYFLDPEGNALSSLEIGSLQGGLPFFIHADDKFGLAVAHLPDLDGNGVTDIAVGAADDGSHLPTENPGLLYILFMEPGGMVGSAFPIGEFAGGFTSTLDALDRLGEALTWGPSTEPGSVGTLWVGAHGDDTAGADAGAVWRLAIAGEANPPSAIVRNGIHLNPVALQSTSLPVIDSNWTADVDTAALPTATSTFLVGYEDPWQFLLGFGELLVLIEPFGVNAFVDQAPVVAGVGQHSLPIPDDLAFLGREFHVQGLLAGGGVLLTNAVELTIGKP